MLAGALALGLEGTLAKNANGPNIKGPRETSYRLKIKAEELRAEREDRILSTKDC